MEPMPDTLEDPTEDTDSGKNHAGVVIELTTNAIRPTAEGDGGQRVNDATRLSSDRRRAIEDAGRRAYGTNDRTSGRR
jgi:hypothetical protein